MDVEGKIQTLVQSIAGDPDVDRVEDVGRSGIWALQVWTKDGRVIDVVVEDITETI